MTDTSPFPHGPLYRLTDLWPKSEDELDQALETMGDLYAQQDAQAADPAEPEEGADQRPTACRREPDPPRP